MEKKLQYCLNWLFFSLSCIRSFVKKVLDRYVRSGKLDVDARGLEFYGHSLGGYIAEGKKRRGKTVNLVLNAKKNRCGI